jgi:hypothetical protein
MGELRRAARGVTPRATGVVAAPPASAVGGSHVPQPCGIADHRDELRGIDGLAEMNVEPGGERTVDLLGGREAAHRYERRVHRGTRAQVTREIEAAATR